MFKKSFTFNIFFEIIQNVHKPTTLTQYGISNFGFNNTSYQCEFFKKIWIIFLEGGRGRGIFVF